MVKTIVDICQYCGEEGVEIEILEDMSFDGYGDKFIYFCRPCVFMSEYNDLTQVITWH